MTLPYNKGLITEELKSLIANIRIVVFDFDGVFTDNCVYVFQDGTEAVSCWRSDGLGLAELKKLELPVWVVSTEKNQVVSARCKKLQIKCIQGCEDKLTALKELVERYGYSFNDVLYLGNDINDIDCLQSVGLPIVVADAHPDVFEFSKYVTLNSGGRGAVREVCDLIVSVRRS